MKLEGTPTQPVTLRAYPIDITMEGNYIVALEDRHGIIEQVGIFEQYGLAEVFASSLAEVYNQSTALIFDANTGEYLLQYFYCEDCNDVEFIH